MTEPQTDHIRVGYRSIALSRLTWDEKKFEEAAPKAVEDPESFVGEVIWNKEEHVYFLANGYGHLKWLLEHGEDRHRYWFHLLRARVATVSAG